MRRLGILFWVCVAWLVLVVGMACAAPWLPLADPEANQVEVGFRPPYPPSVSHPLGTDQDARDVLSRTVFGARVSLTVGLAAMVIGLVAGGALGVVAGYLRGRLDTAISFAFVCLLSFPSLVLAILVTSLLERGVATIAVTLGILAIAPVGRVARGSVLSLREREYVMAARLAGAREIRILVREIVPGVVVPMSSLALLGVAVAVVAEGGLAFLGLSVEKGPTWGKVILSGAGRTELSIAPWIALSPLVVLLLTVLALNLAGERLQSALDERDAAL
jgi:peptide/nickel transport system permease protein